MAKRSGPKLLVRWRGVAGLSQAALATKIVPTAHQPTVAQWEKRAGRRPSLAVAMQLHAMSGGAVPVTSWGYTLAEIDATVAATHNLSTREAA